jgi:hypothetical protein
MEFLFFQTIDAEKVDLHFTNRFHFNSMMKRGFENHGSSDEEEQPQKCEEDPLESFTYPYSTSAAAPSPVTVPSAATTTTTAQGSSRFSSTALINNIATTTTTNLSVDPEMLFPNKLFVMLHDAAEQGFHNIVSWGEESSQAFKVHHKRDFERIVLPKYFKMTKYKSFTRQLHNYEFFWIRTGLDKGGCTFLS